MMTQEKGPRPAATGATLSLFDRPDDTPRRPHPQAADGERRKFNALATLAARRELYVLRGRRALLRRLLDAAEATADDVRNAVELPDAINPVCLGVVPGPLARAGIVERVGFAESCRADAHARPISCWALVDADAARAWLTAYPDRPDPVPASEADTARTLFDSDGNATPGAVTPGAAHNTKGASRCNMSIPHRAADS